MSNALKFSIDVPRGPVKMGARIIMNMTLENEGSSPLYVNARFAVVPRAGDVWLAVRHEGQSLPFQLRVRLAPLKNSDFLLLAPGEQVVAGYELTKGYRFTKPGVYEFSAEYVAESVPEALAKETVFQGRKSATTVLTIS